MSVPLTLWARSQCRSRVVLFFLLAPFSGSMNCWLYEADLSCGEVLCPTNTSHYIISSSDNKVGLISINAISPHIHCMVAFPRFYYKSPELIDKVYFSPSHKSMQVNDPASQFKLKSMPNLVRSQLDSSTYAILQSLMSNSRCLKSISNSCKSSPIQV